jgi:hypothetical protein
MGQWEVRSLGGSNGFSQQEVVCPLKPPVLFARKGASGGASREGGVSRDGALLGSLRASTGGALMSIDAARKRAVLIIEPFAGYSGGLETFRTAECGVIMSFRAERAQLRSIVRLAQPQIICMRIVHQERLLASLTGRADGMIV